MASATGKSHVASRSEDPIHSVKNGKQHKFIRSFREISDVLHL